MGPGDFLPCSSEISETEASSEFASHIGHFLETEAHPRQAWRGERYVIGLGSSNTFCQGRGLASNCQAVTLS